MQSTSRTVRVGASLSTLGAGIVVFTDFMLNAYRTLFVFQLVWLAVPPLLIIFGISAFFCFSKLPRWLLVLYCVVSMLSLVLQVFIYLGGLIFACFDMCSPQGTAMVYWLLLGLFAFLLNVIGAFILLNAPQSKKG